MKVYSLPDVLPAPVISIDDIKNGEDDKKKAAHSERLKAYLKEIGYDGTHTGRIYHAPQADGRALYMFADSPSENDCESVLVHLPYGDAWISPDVEFVPREEVIARMDANDNVMEHFSSMSLAGLYKKLNPDVSDES